MSRLNYATVNEAFKLGSDQIKNTQEEIAKLKALVMDSSIIDQKSLNGQTGQSNSMSPVPVVKTNYERIGPAPEVSATFSKGSNESMDDTLLTTNGLLKLMNSPKFDDIVKNYISVKHPDWSLKETNYSKETFGLNKEMNNIFIFMIITIIIYLLCSLIDVN
jgi:hypothetical protein